MTQRWKITVEYDGTPYAGWQMQKGVMTVQQALEEAIGKFSGEQVRVSASGRTDAGVHAVGQVAHFDLERESEPKNVRDAINAHLREHKIAVLAAEPAPPEFHSRFSAINRLYCYRITCGRYAPLRIDEHRSWHIKRDLDLAAMQAGAKHLVGTHDFTSFRASECQAKSPVRTVERVEVTEHEDTLRPGRQIELWVEARSFLHHQVRNFAGTLKLVGEGKWRPEDVKTALDARDRAEGGPTAPPHGLYFIRVDY